MCENFHICSTIFHTGYVQTFHETTKIAKIFSLKILYVCSISNHLLHGTLTFFSSSVDGSWELWMRVSSLGSYDNISPILGSLNSNGFTDSSTGPSDEYCTTCQCSTI